MKVSEYRKVSGAYLRGRYGEAFVVTAICLFAFTAFKSAAVLAAYAMGDMKYFSLIDAGISVLSFLVMTPLLTGAFWWFFQTVCERDNRNLLKLYSGFRLNGRAILIYTLMWSKGFFSLFPTAICFTAAYIFLYGKTGLGGNMTLFLTFHMLILGIVLIVIYFNTLLSMVLAPFLFISRPDANPFSIIRQSSKLMRGNKLRFVAMIFGYIPAMLPIVTIPFVIPSAAMSAAVFARDILDDFDTPSGASETGLNSKYE